MRHKKIKLRSIILDSSTCRSLSWARYDSQVNCSTVARTRRNIKQCEAPSNYRGIIFTLCVHCTTLSKHAVTHGLRAVVHQVVPKMSENTKSFKEKSPLMISRNSVILYLVWILKCGCFNLLCNVWWSVCVGFVMCGCTYVWVFW